MKNTFFNQTNWLPWALEIFSRVYTTEKENLLNFTMLVKTLEHSIWWLKNAEYGIFGYY